MLYRTVAPCSGGWDVVDVESGEPVRGEVEPSDSSWLCSHEDVALMEDPRIPMRHIWVCPECLQELTLGEGT